MWAHVVVSLGYTCNNTDALSHCCIAGSQQCSARTHAYIPVLTWILSTCQHVVKSHSLHDALTIQYRGTIVLQHGVGSALFSPEPTPHTCVDLDTLNMSTCGHMSWCL